MTKNSFVAEVTFNELFIELSINEVCSNPFQELKNIRLENAENLLIGHLNVNSLRSMFPLKN